MQFVRTISISLFVIAGLLGIISAIHGQDRQHPTSGAYFFPKARPLCLVELAPSENIWAKIDDLSPLETGEILVIPMYRQYRDGERTLPYAAAHPFLYRPGEDLETPLAARGQRDRVARLVLLARGYFPASVERMFRVDHAVKGSEVTVIQLQGCIGDEWDRIRSAMRTLLKEKQFTVVEPEDPFPTNPPYSRVPVATTCPYNMDILIRGKEFTGRYMRDGAARPFGVWNIRTGSVVSIVMSDDDKRLIQRFIDQPGEKPLVP